MDVPTLNNEIVEEPAKETGTECQQVKSEQVKRKTRRIQCLISQIKSNFNCLLAYIMYFLDSTCSLSSLCAEWFYGITFHVM